MNFATLTGATTAALMISAAGATAATLTLDDFSADQFVSDAPFDDFETTSSVTDDSIFGGTRDLAVNNTQFNGPVDEGQTTLSSGGAADLLQFSNNDGARGEATITYNGGGNGLGNILPGAGVNPRIVFAGAEFDLSADITVSGVDGDGDTISFEERIMGQPGVGFSPVLFFSEFEGIEDFDLTNVSSLQFEVSSVDTVNSVDGSLGAIEITAVPLPASGLLLVAGLGGLGVAARRRKAAA